jgi:hypothetical protein
LDILCIIKNQNYWLAALFLLVPWHPCVHSEEFAQVVMFLSFS